MSTAPVKTIDAVVDAAGAHIRPLLDALERRLVELTAGHGETLARHGGDTIAAGGKRLRPLVVLVAAGEPPDGDSARLVRAAAAVELIHSATLVHDDVLDGAELRRGRPSVVAAAGREIATATGDLLFSRAFAELAANGRADEVRVLSAASTSLARGELLQRADAFDPGVSVERYLKRCELKTACLFEAACRLGALESPGPAAAHEAQLGDFGRRIGLAFQLLDDVLDVSGPAHRTGKRPGADLLDGTVTLPFILARERDPELERLDPRSITSPEQAEAVCEAIAATGALEESRRRAVALVEGTKSTLPALPAGQLCALGLMADGLVERYA
jgi:geranylgeranyl pyrophosphate synthase